MSQPRLACAALALSISLLSACSEPATNVFPGYAEGEYVRIASPLAGSLARIHVARGSEAAANAPAFALEQDSEAAARREAEARVARAQAALNNMLTGRRPAEVAAVEAQLAQARAALELSQADLARQSGLAAGKFIAPARVDEAKSAVERDRARVRELGEQTKVARLPARDEEIRAARGDLAAAEAALAQANWRLEQKTQRLPAAGRIIDVHYREGEYVNAGSPVVTLLPPQNIKARFFVPQEALGALRLGQEVTLSCDGCGAPLAAKLSFIAAEAEYTAPIIYSRENRAKLVFMIEARPAPADAVRLHPGQPLEIRLAGK